MLEIYLDGGTQKLGPVFLLFLIILQRLGIPVFMLKISFKIIGLNIYKSLFKSKKKFLWTDFTVP